MPYHRIAVPQQSSQIAHLVYPGFLIETPWERFAHFGRYLRAIRIRIERAAQSPVKDRKRTAQVAAFWQPSVPL